jgi:prephenate dehydrogenase
LASVLEPVFEAAGAAFVGGHPMAGSEKTGPAHARADLFQGAACILTPTVRTAPENLHRIEQLWRGVGGLPLHLTPDLHDQLVARTSHLPHLVASALVHLVLDPTASPEQARVCAGGFRDTTRVASGSPAMWRDIASMNAAPLADAIDDLIARLGRIRSTLANGDTDGLERFFEMAKQRRDAWLSDQSGVRPEVRTGGD